MTVLTDVEGFFSGIAAEFHKLVAAFDATTFGAGFETAGAAVVKEVGALAAQDLTSLIASGAGAAVAAVATGGGEAVVLAAAANAIRAQVATSRITLTTAALTSLAAHVTTSVLVPGTATAAPAPQPSILTNIRNG